MPWWIWVLVWVCLALALVAVLVVGALWLWRKLMRLADDLGTLADQAAVLENVSDAPPPGSVPAVLRDIEAVRRDRSVRVARRYERKRLRRLRRLDRAARITSLDATTVRWPDAWYGPRGR